MFTKEKQILKIISEELSIDDRRILKIIVYGSRVRGDHRGDSDLDVLVVVDKKDRDIKDKILSIFYSYELQTDISFAVTIFSLEEWEFNERLGSPFLESIKKEGNNTPRSFGTPLSREGN
ncbi:MAG: nucleotidyltransferase domain-containing protein [Nitrospirota bacterium]